jgi:GDPmannose 4,6-dehydratase
VSARRALVTGISGQDGSYLAELLLDQGYDVTGVVRDPRAEHPNLVVRDQVTLLRGDLLEPATLVDAIETAEPDELYHLGAPTFVPDSYEHPERTHAAIAGATATLLDAAPAQARVFVATSSEIFGDTTESPQNEDSPKLPRSPYGEAKLAAHEVVGAVRTGGAFAVSGITYNHESVRRPERFLPRKVSRGVAAIAAGRADELVLGDLDAVRDWSAATDIVRGAWLSLQADVPDDYVFASGVGRTVRELAEAAFASAGLDMAKYVRVDETLVRGPEGTPLVGDPSRARERLGWEPLVTFEQLIAEMVEHDLAELTGG